MADKTRNETLSSAKGSRGAAKVEKIFLRKFKKGLDKPSQPCYTKYVIKRIRCFSSLPTLPGEIRRQTSKSP